MTNRFTPEQIAELRANPNVKAVFENIVRFTAEFKNEAWARYTNGETMREILRAKGIRPEILGESRIFSLVTKLKKEVEQYGNFSATRRDLPKPSNEEAQTLMKLQHRVAYMEQELEFLKKTILMDQEAKRKHTGKRPRKANMN